MEKPAIQDPELVYCYRRKVVSTMHRAPETSENLCTLCPAGCVGQAHLDGDLTTELHKSSGRGKAGNLLLCKASFHDPSLALHYLT